jgi:hypothetical protein
MIRSLKTLMILGLINTSCRNDKYPQEESCSGPTEDSALSCAMFKAISECEVDKKPRVIKELTAIWQHLDSEYKVFYTYQVSILFTCESTKKDAK